MEGISTPCSGGCGSEECGGAAGVVTPEAQLPVRACEDRGERWN